ncbi:hypothetical protein RRF57_007870 [Xylaria bambusicola]|uniref:Uncharacterized protein n=1 Tax=Xylaria bambusicola TaxID=326684 RepID=A0AAN7UUC5_9PEZI
MAADTATYVPSDTYTKRFWEKEATREKIEVDVPNGFPRHIDSPLAWTGSDIEMKESEWKLSLTTEELVAIDSALSKFEGRPLYATLPYKSY